MRATFLLVFKITLWFTKLLIIDVSGIECSSNNPMISIPSHPLTTSLPPWRYKQMYFIFLIITLKQLELANLKSTLVNLKLLSYLFMIPLKLVSMDLLDNGLMLLEPSVLLVRVTELGRLLCYSIVNYYCSDSTSSHTVRDL